MRRSLLILVLTAALPGLAQAEICAAWGPPERIGALSRALLPEASGMAASRRFPDRLYHHNDSGQGPVIHLTDGKGAAKGRFSLSGFAGADIEDIALAPCGDGGDCLYVGDIGDNAAARRTVEFAVWREAETVRDREAPLRVVRARYPDAPHNAEGFAIHPGGDLYLVTKVGSAPAATRLFKLTAAQLADASGQVQTFAPVASFDLAALFDPAGAPRGSPPAATAFDIAPDGARALIMTYRGAVELGFDLSKPLPPQADWRRDRDWRVIPTAPLPQAEAVTYVQAGKAIVYGSETAGGQDSALYRQTCAR